MARKIATIRFRCPGCGCTPTPERPIVTCLIGSRVNQPTATACPRSGWKIHVPSPRDDCLRRDLAQMDLIRFPGQPDEIRWPSVVIDLARGFAEGRGLSLAVCDALIEAGHPHLAEHFRGRGYHPADCWALRMILQTANQ